MTCLRRGNKCVYCILGNPGQPMGMITTPRLPSGVDAQKLQRIQALQQELQREYREVGQAQTAQSVTSMGQQQGIVTGQETMIMSQPRMINVQTSMQQQPQGGLRQVKSRIVKHYYSFHKFN